MRLVRFAWGGGVAASSWLLAAEPVGPARLETVKLQLKWSHQFQFAGYYTAVEKGYYRDAGLEVEIREGRSGVDFVHQVATGAADYGTEMPDLLLRRHAGEPVVVLAAIFQHSPLALGSLATTGINSPHDLVGRRVMLRAGGDAELRAMLVREGVALDKVKVGEHSFDVEDLRRGRTDAISMYYALDGYEFRSRGLVLNVLEPVKYGVDFYGDCLFTSELELRGHPGRVRAFRDASLRGWNYAMDHVEEIAGLIHHKYAAKRSVEALRAEAEAMKSLFLHQFVEIGHMNPGRWQQIGDTYVELGLLPADYSLQGFLYEPEQPAPNTWLKWLAGLASVGVLLSGMTALALYAFNRRLNAAVTERTARLNRLNGELEREVREREKTERQLQLQSRLQELLTRIAATYLNLPLTEIESAIQVSLGEMGRFVEADRCTLFRYDFDRNLASETHEWRREGVPSMFIAGQALPLADFRDWDLAAHRRGEPIAIADARALPAGALRDLLERGQIRSLLAMPVGWHGECIGFVNFGWTRAPHTSAEPERRLLAIFAQMLGSVRRRREADDALRASEAKYRSIFENALAGIFRSGKEGRFHSGNRAMARLLGYDSAEEMLTAITNVSAQVYAEPGEPERVWQMIARDGRVENLELEFRRKDGRRIWVLLNAHGVVEATGRLLYIEGSCLDITEHKQNAELQLAKARAETANRAKSMFLARMSHEIRTPMNAILGFAQLMNRDPALSGTQRERLRVIGRNGEHLLTLINDILEMSKIEAQQATLDAEPFSLAALVRDLRTMTTASAEAKGLALSVTIPPGLPERVTGDAGKLRQILVNLLGNAIKFTQRGQVALRVDLEPRQPGGWRFRAEVEDTGPGISPAEIEHLFQPFEQAAQGRKSGAGTGLGLAISREFARLMGGEVSVASEVGRGSVFRLEVFLARADHPGIQDSTTPESPTAWPTSAARGCRVLLVDDLADNRQLLREMLAPAGCDVREALSGAEAVALAAVWQPRLIFMDLRMPDMDGIEAIRRIRAQPESSRIKIICHSASVFSDDREQAMAAGSDCFMAKPFREEVLWSTVGKLFGWPRGPAWTEELSSPVVRDERMGSAPAVPAESISALRRAVFELDLDRIMALIAQVRLIHPALAEDLGRCAAAFDYDGLAALLPTESEGPAA